MDSLLEAVGSLKELPNMFNAGAQLASTILDDKNKKNMEVANAELRNQQARMQAFEKAEMDKFSHRTDFENFEKEWNEDLARFKAQYNSSSGENAYTSNYTAMKGNEMFDMLKTNGDANLNSMINAKKTEYANIKDFNTIDIINETVADPQEKLTEVNGIYDRMKARGGLDETEYHKLVQDNLNKVQYEWTVAKAEHYVVENIGISNAAYKSYVENLTADDFIAAHRGHGDEAIYLKAQPEAIEAAQKTILQNLHDKQSRFNSRIYSTNTEIINDVAMASKPVGELLTEIRTQINFIEGQPQIALADDDRRMRLKELYSLVDDLEQAADDPNSSGSRKASTTAYKTQINNDMKMYLNAGANGTNNIFAPGTDSMYAAWDAFEQDEKAAYFAAGKSEEEFKLNFFNDFFEQAEHLISEVNPEVKVAFSKIKKMSDDYLKKTDKEKYWPLEAEVMEYAWDLVMATDMSKFKPEELIDQVDKYLRNTTTKELAILKTEGNTWINDYDANSIKDLALGISELQNNDLAWTDRKGRQHINENALENLNEEIIPAQVELLYYAGATGDIQIQRTQTTDDSYDIDLNPKYKDAAGNEYEFVSTGEKTFNILKNGKVISDSEDIQDKQKAADRKTRADFKAKRKQLKEEQKKLRVEKQKSINAMVENKVAPAGINQIEWNSMRPDQRRDYIYELQLNDINAYNEYKAQSTQK